MCNTCEVLGIPSSPDKICPAEDKAVVPIDLQPLFFEGLFLLLVFWCFLLVLNISGAIDFDIFTDLQCLITVLDTWGARFDKSNYISVQVNRNCNT